jgi:anti-sigma B factor antagonist
MTQSTAALDVRKISPQASVIDIAGDLTGERESALMEAYNTATTIDTKAVVLNFSPLEYMNSTGIGLLVTLLVRANRQGQTLLAYGLTDHYRQILELTRLDEAIEVYESEADALAAAGA